MMMTHLSVVIPTCNRPEDLTRCLMALAPGAQQGMKLMQNDDSLPNGPVPPTATPADGSYEVVVSDDGAFLSSKKLVRESFPWAKYVAGPQRGPAANRNCGARNASGEWAVFIDDDCIPSSGWLQAISGCASDHGIDVIEGRTVMPDKRDSPFMHGVENEKGGCYWSCNLAVRRAQFIEMRGFDEAFLQAACEDMEFAWRFKQKGLNARFEPHALVLHPQRRYSVCGFLRRIFLLKWVILYDLKIGRAPSVGSPFFKVVISVISRYLVALLRQTRNSILVVSVDGWRTRWFNCLWGWLLIPIQLPYILWWEIQFRRLKSQSEVP